MSQNTNASTTGTSPRPSVKDGPILREHTFDGIQEYDQKLPNWWLFTFYIMIVFFICFWVYYYSFGGMNSPEAEIKAEMSKIETIKQKALEAMLDKLDDAVLVEWSQNKQILSKGEEIYKAQCVACHNQNLEGGIGRSLVDAHWEYGGKPMEIFNLVLKGSPADSQGFNQAKMAPYESILGAEKTAQVTAYIMSKSPHIDKSSASQ